MSGHSNGRVLVFVGDDYEDLELWYPRLRLAEAGFEVKLAGLDAPGTNYRGKHGYPATSDMRVADANAAEFAALVIPGGWMPDKLRRDPDVLRLTREFAESGKPVASICHGPWVLISAGVCEGRRMTSSPGIKDDLANARAAWSDAEVLVDENYVTSRRPDDLPAFMRELLRMLGSRGES